MNNIFNCNSSYWNKKRLVFVSNHNKNPLPIFIPATYKQREYLKVLGYKEFDASYLSKDKAMEMISQLKEGGERTTHQSQDFGNAAPTIQTHSDAV